MMDIVFPFVAAVLSERKWVGLVFAIGLLGVRCRFLCDGKFGSLGHTIADSTVEYEDTVSSNIRNDIVF